MHTEDAADNLSTTTLVEVALCTTWITRQVWHECLQYNARSLACDYFNGVWNVIDSLLFGLWVVMSTLMSFAPQLWWCKQVATAIVLLAYMKVAYFARGLPGLGRLVQLVIAVVSAMKNFLALLGLTIVGLSLAFLLVFSVAHTSSRKDADPFANGVHNASFSSSLSIAPDLLVSDDSIEFGSVPISLFRSFTTIVGDFDVQTLWQQGSPAVAVFLSAVMFGNIVMLNLLIAIVSDEFEQFMERAELEAQLALAAICEEARCVLRIAPNTRPELFQRHLFVLRPKAREGLAATDAWAGKVNAIVKRVDGLEGNIDSKLKDVKTTLGDAQAEMEGNIDSKLKEVKTTLGDAQAEMNDKICGLEAKMDGLEAKMDSNFAKMLNALERLGASD
eukprot:COSAG02_NODE_643_length_19037_cov_9.951632_16_plen_390_part_00